MYTMEFETEAPFEIIFDAEKGQKQTFTDPGFPDAVYIKKITLFGEPLTAKQMDAFIKMFDYAALEGECLDYARECAEEERYEL